MTSERAVADVVWEEFDNQNFPTAMPSEVLVFASVAVVMG